MLTTAAADDDGHVYVYAKIVERSLDAIKMMIVLMNCDLVPNVASDLAPNVCNLQINFEKSKQITQLKNFHRIESTRAYVHTASVAQLVTLAKRFYSIFAEEGDDQGTITTYWLLTTSNGF